MTHSEKQAFWISIGSSCVMGIIIGILLVLLYFLGYFFIGAVFGTVIAVYGYAIFESLVHFHSFILQVISISLFSVLFGGTALIWHK